MNKSIIIKLLCFLHFVSLKSQIVIQKLANLNTNSQHCSPTFKEFENVLYFNAGLGLFPGNGLEPWKYEFDNVCPHSFLDLNKNTINNTNSNPIFLTSIGDKILFTATDGNSNYTLWNTDGNFNNASKIIGNLNSFYLTQPSCFSLGSFKENVDYAMINNQLIFNGNDSNNGEELWVSNGVTASLIKDIEPSKFSNGLPVSSSPQNLIVVGNFVYFIANTKQYYYELWQTDGTSNGTKLVKDIYKGSRIQSYTGPKNLFVFNNQLFFSANDSIHGEELWVSNGTESGTFMVKDIHVGSADSKPYQFTILNNKLCFLATNGTSGTELWTYDPANGMVSLVKDLTFSGNSLIEEFVISRNKLYFINNGSELWESDGTSSGTNIIKSGLLYASNLHSFAGKLFFNNNSSLWVSDGTTVSTIELKSNINPRKFISMGSQLLIYETNKFHLCDSQLLLKTINNPTGVNIYGDIFKKNNSIFFEGGDNSGYHLFRIGDSIPPCNIFTSVQNAEPNNTNLTIYPNPNSSNIIHISMPQISNYKLFDAYGKQLCSGDLTEGINSIEILGYNNGIYFIKIEGVFHPFSVQK